MLIDLHMHSTYSPDGHNTVDELCQRALELGLSAIAITDHMEWMPDGGRMEPDFPRYFEDIAAAQARFGPAGLTVLSGVELGNPHEYSAKVDALRAAYDFDVVIGSIHWLYDRNIHDPHIFDRVDPNVIYADYFDAMAAMAAQADFQIVAHFDRIFRSSLDAYGPPRIEQVEAPVRRALDAMAEHGRLLELNTRFLTLEPGWQDTLETVLTWYGEAGGTEVSVNSDAHRAREVARSREEGEAMVRAAGLTPAPAPTAQRA